MRFLGTSLLALSLIAAMTLPSAAQTAPDVTKLFTSSADVQALIAKAKAERKDGEPMVSEPILTACSVQGRSRIPRGGKASIHACA